MHKREAVPAEGARHPFEPQLVTVPAGPFLMGTTPEEVARLLAEAKEQPLWRGQGSECPPLVARSATRRRVCWEGKSVL